MLAVRCTTQLDISKTLNLKCSKERVYKQNTQYLKMYGDSIVGCFIFKTLKINVLSIIN
jgi:hypothetical protein